jgi:predicted nucleic acid-binding protein
VQRGECDEGAAIEIRTLWETDRPKLIPGHLLSERALDLALRLEHSAYDCLYIAAAVEHDAVLLTADSKMERMARGLVGRTELIS